MSATYSIYRLVDGCFTGRVLDVPPAMVVALVESSLALGEAYVQGRFYPQCHRVQQTADGPVVVEVRAAAPADDEWRTWEWSDSAHQYVQAPTLLALQRNAKAAIDQAAGAARTRYITDVPGQQAVYVRKLEQAHAFVDAGGVGDMPPYIAAEAAATGADPLVAAQSILAIAAQWDDVLSPAIEGARLAGKRAVDAALSAADVNDAYQIAAAALAAI